MSFGSNPFNALVPFFTNVREAPEYLANTTARVSPDSFYWANRLIAALADARFRDNENAIDRYREKVGAFGHKLIHETDEALACCPEENVQAVLAAANLRMADYLREQTDTLLSKVLYTTSLAMKNHFAMSDN